MGHNETQKKEETNIAYMLSEYLSIPFEQFNVLIRIYPGQQNL